MRHYMVLIAVIALLSGCTTTKNGLFFGYDRHLFTNEIPTTESIKTTFKERQIYRKTTFFLSDFNESGELKTLFDYEYSNEDSPCTVLGEAYRESPIFKSAFYTIGPKGGKPFVFECRPTNRTANAMEFRLFMIGSYHECQQRRWDYKNSTIPYLRDWGKQCAIGLKTKANEMLEREYKSVFAGRTELEFFKASQKH